MVRERFHEVTSQNVEKLLIPEKLHDEKASSIAEECQTMVRARYKYEMSFCFAVLKTYYQTKRFFKLNKKLTNWWELDFPVYN